MDIMLSLYGVLLGCTKPQAMPHISVKQNNTTMNLDWVERLEYFPGMIKLLEFMLSWQK